ncbi:hypothetical protein DOY81_002370 [Sarcophaga bullata]|nr:hypothetical protein DOY81_002370 [Sarcophaga bullata]
MENIWNDFELKKPPFVTLPAEHGHFVLKLHGAIDTYFSKQSQLDEEFNDTAALLSRLMARRKNSFNKMKGFKDVCKLNAALCRLLRLDFKRDLDSFRYTLPDVVYEDGTTIHLPSRETYDFVLLRILALYELHVRIGDCCMIASEYFICQLRQYFFFEINTLLVAVLAKIYNLNNKLANIAVELYNSSISCRYNLPINPKSKLFKDERFMFPEKLKTITTAPLNNKRVFAINKESLNELVMQDQNVTTVKAEKLKKSDVGKAIPRSFKPQTRFNIEKLNSVESIKAFIVAESKSRSSNLNSAITKQILNHEWAGATKLFERKIKNGEEKKATSIFRKFLTLKMI